MKHAFLLAAAAFALGTIPAAATAQGASASAPAPDWAARVETTATGGYRMGNPDAAVKLVEYGSITCSHCADFSEAAAASIRRHVQTGRVSFEYRPYLIFPSDPVLFRLLQCQAPGRFFSTVESLYATQSTWVEAIQAKGQELAGLNGWGELMPAILRASGLTPVFAGQGMSAQQITACLTDQAAFDRLVAMRDEAATRGVDGTPTFFLNDRKLDVSDWPSIEPLLSRP